MLLKISVARDGNEATREVFEDEDGRRIFTFEQGPRNDPAHLPWQPSSTVSGTELGETWEVLISNIKPYAATIVTEDAIDSMESL